MAYSNIDKPNQHFNTVLYTGTGSSLSISSLDFSPDWVWIKRRNATDNHALFNSVRGATKILQSNVTNAEATVAQSLTSFDSNGFTVGTDGQVNTNTEGHVAWNWLAGGTASSNTDGDVTSNVSANQTAGFSVVTVSNLNSNSFGHGLGVEPEFIINKRTDDIANWRVYFKGIDSGKSLFLNTTAAQAVEGSCIASANSTTITVTGSGNGGTPGTGTTVYYCFAPKKGFSATGTYTGNGSTDGTFVYTGFKPAFVIVKMTSSTGNWSIFDNKRDSFNVVDNMIKGNDSQAELVDSSRKIDFNSSGFKIRANHADINTSGGTYIYMAFAESPLVGSNLVPNNAR